MKNKSLHTFLLTALVAASACVMEVRAQTTNIQDESTILDTGMDMSPIYNATQILRGIPDSNHETVNCDSSVTLSSIRKGETTSYSFSMCLDLYNNFGYLRTSLPKPVYLKLTNADAIDSSILAKVDSLGDYTDFVPKSVGQVTLTYEGDIVINGTIRHITVDQIVTVKE
ncbi:MAG: hypothetical protein FJ390_04730 [Verrucomicrobia bacterium]|nr:hypothetical protein [Verrucomicrobiota bacterium]